MMEKCPFCKSKDLVGFDEHYTFCKGCTAIYTYYIILETNCDHIQDDAVCVIREPWYKEVRENTVYVKETTDDDMEIDQVCSKCGKEVWADGW